MKVGKDCCWGAASDQIGGVSIFPFLQNGGGFYDKINKVKSDEYTK